MSVNVDRPEGQGLQSQLPPLTIAAAQSTQRAVRDPGDPGLLDSISGWLCEGGVTILMSQRRKLKNRKMKLGVRGRGSQGVVTTLAARAAPGNSLDTPTVGSHLGPQNQTRWEGGLVSAGPSGDADAPGHPG